MFLSVIIPTFNRAHYLKQTIDSVLNQSYDDFEIVVVDNASTDGTLKLMQEYEAIQKVRYFRNPINMGMVFSWRRAVYELANGDWFMILSDDDYLIQLDYLRIAANLISTVPELNLVYSDGYLLSEESGEKTLLDLPFAGVVSGIDIFTSRGQVKPQDFTLCNVLFKSQLARRFNSFSNPDNLSCDTELFLLSCLCGEVGVIKGPSTVYRIHSNNLLKSVSFNSRLSFGSFDSLITPYLVAQKMGLNDCAEKLRISSRMDYIIITNSLKIACLDWPLFLEVKASIANRAPKLADEIFSSPLYRLAEGLCKAFPFTYNFYTKLKVFRFWLFRYRKL